MSEGREEVGGEGGPPEPVSAGSSLEPPRGGSRSRISWAIVSANVLAVFALGLAVAALVFQFTEEEEGGAPGAAGQPTATVQPTPTAPIVVQNVSVDDAPRWGPEDAPVTIVEFSDFL